MEGIALSDDRVENDLDFIDPYNVREIANFDGYSDLCGSSSTPGGEVLPTLGFSSLFDAQSLSVSFPALSPSSPFSGNDLIPNDPCNLDLMDFDSYSDLCGSSSTTGNEVLPSLVFSSLHDSQSLSGSIPVLSSSFAGQNTGNLRVMEDSSSPYDSTTSNTMDSSSPSPNVFDENIAGDFYHGPGQSSEAHGYCVNNEDFSSYLNICKQSSSTHILNSNSASDRMLMEEQSLITRDNHRKEDNYAIKNAGTWDWMQKDPGNLPYEKGTSIISRSLGSSFGEKMLKAMSLFKESSRGEILTHAWMPVKQGEGYALSTCHQLYLPDQVLAGYREVSRSFTFSAIEKPGSFPGLPGRVFISRIPEWTSNVGYYGKAEFLRMNEARDHEVRGTLALPVFELNQESCCAVLEIATPKEMANFDKEMENICNALRAVNLRTAQGRVQPQNHSESQRVALAEIGNVLKAVCHAHKLPLALTWAPYRVPEAIHGKLASRELNAGQCRTVLCVQDSACYVKDRWMQGFMHACSEHYLEKGQGIAGKALQSNSPFFCADVKEYNIRDYPLAHHARKFGLNAAVAIRLRSTYTGEDDYILELFLPVNCKGSSEQKLLLDSLAGTMQKICQSLRTVWDGETAGVGDAKVGIRKGAGKSFFSIDMPKRRSHLSLSESEVDSSENMTNKIQSRGLYEIEADIIHGQNATVLNKQLEKKRFTVEKNISLSVLQQHFSGSLKDAAKAIGVCPTTLKRICRQHGISRWPSRKINKVTRSLKKIQTVINSVQGVEEALRYDPITRGLVATPMVQDLEMPNCIFSSQNNAILRSIELEGKHSKPGSSVSSIEESQQLVGRLETDNYSIGGNQMNTSGNSGLCKNEPNIAGTQQAFSEVNSHSSSSSQSMEYMRDGRLGITVKATYKEDTVRFKLTSSMGTPQLFEEVGKRFRLPTGTFQLKYLDDEEEWVMLVTDADLQECLEMLDSVGSHNVKLIVRDLPCSAGSPVSGTCR